MLCDLLTALVVGRFALDRSRALWPEKKAEKLSGRVLALLGCQSTVDPEAEPFHGSGWLNILVGG